VKSALNGNFLNLTMGPKRTRGQRHTPYDPELLENWTINRLREELNNRNSRPPSSARRMALVRLLRDSRSINDVSIGHDSTSDSLIHQWMKQVRDPTMHHKM